MAMFNNATGSPIAVGTNPVSNATADLDGDGHLDLLFTNYISDNISVLFGDGDGGFTAGAPVPVVNGPREIVVGKIDGDGDIDFVASNYSGNNISVRLNNGNGTFASGGDVAVGTVPRYVALGDLDGDGDLDFVSGNYTANTLSVMLNDGSGAFTQATGSPIAVGTHPVGIVLGHFDDDDDLDIAVANNSNSNVSILLNNGSAGFAAASGSPVTVGTGPRGITAGDLDGDGDTDLVVANFGANTLSILLNNGSAGFVAAAGSPLSTGNNPYHVEVGDLDGDGDLDIAVTNSGSSSVSVFLNDGSAGFAAASGGPFAVGVSPGGIVMGDFDEDGDLDLSTANFGSNTTSILINASALYSVTTNLRAAEGTPPGAGGELVFTISRNATSEAEDITYSLSGSATAGVDFTAPSGTASFAAGQVSVEIHIPIAADSGREPNESVTMTLTTASGEGLFDPSFSSATGKIVNDDFVRIRGTADDDRIDGDNTVQGEPKPSEKENLIKGRGGDDQLSGLGGDDSILGNKGDDVLRGNGGGDILSGGYGENKLIGGGGDDSFVFDAKLGEGKAGKGNDSFSRITDFAAGDFIELEQSVFKKLDLGVLSEAAFRDIGEDATEETRIVYKENGELAYDKDGKGGADAIVFAKLLTSPDIDASDLLVLA